MKRSMTIGLALLGLLVQTAAHAGITIHAAEMGIGKFHRMDNKAHAYAPNNLWRNYVLPAGVNEKQQQIYQNSDGSYTIFFTNLEEMFAGVVQISQKTGQKVSILNLEAHGLPGGMWYPQTAAQRDSSTCASWRDAAYGNDQANYEQYYSAVSKSEIMEFRSYANSSFHFPQPCVAGAKEWAQSSKKVAGFLDSFAPAAEMHFISCIVGLGKTGDAFTQSVAKSLFSARGGKVMTSLYFGLGDYSIPEGMGFWDYVNDAQLDRDNAIYVKNKTDRDIALKGSIRVANAIGAQSTSSVFDQLMFVNTDRPYNNAGIEFASDSVENFTTVDSSTMPAVLRIPGTQAYINARQ
jgi:hypothetical protein